MKYLRLLLLPFSFLFLIVISIRNFLYNHNILKKTQFSTPIISVGNITTGGTGKTPFVIYLIDYFLNKNKSVGVISRGYKRKSDELVIAYNGKFVSSDLQSAGDELYMTVNRFSGESKFFAIAYHNRIKAIKVMIERFSPNLIILDDAFQNRKTCKTLDIVIEDKENNTFFNNILLPAGNLRELKSSLIRADLVLSNYKFSASILKKDNSFIYKLLGVFDYKDNKIDIPKNHKAILISGIANNKSFLNLSNSLQITYKKVYQLSDHYEFTKDDITKYIAEFENDTIFLTTEKDFIKIREFREFVSNYPVYYLRIDVILNNKILDKLFIEKKIL